MAAKLKIIGGELKGMALQSPPEGITRPLRAIMKKSLFDSLGEDVIGESCLDLFSGSGSIGLEAISRGAATCVFVESHPQVFAILQKNVDKIRRYVDNDEVILRPVMADAASFLSGPPAVEAPFGLVFLDPPYVATEVAERCLALLAADAGWMKRDGIVVYQFSGELGIKYNGWRLIDTRAFGKGIMVKLQRDTG